jgi:hypothetical protein
LGSKKMSESFPAGTFIRSDSTVSWNTVINCRFAMRVVSLSSVVRCSQLKDIADANFCFQIVLYYARKLVIVLMKR